MHLADRPTENYVPQSISLGTLKEEKSNRKTFLVGMLLLLTTSVVGGVAMYGYNQRLLPSMDGSFQVDSLSRAQSPSSQTLEPTNADTTNQDIQNPFNGLKIEKNAFDSLKNRPIAIMIDNSPPARSVQENVNRADMVYEGLTEGGYTRFMAIYYTDQSNYRVMPIRSVRMLFLDNLVEYNDILLYHVGGALTPEQPKTDAIGRLIRDKVKSVFYFNGNNWQSFNELYDESCTSNGAIPGYSCKYHFIKTLWDKASAVGYQKEKWEPENKFEWKWKFNESEYTKSSTLANTIKYKFTGLSGFDAEWTYDAAQNKYLRKTAGKIHMDNASKQQLWTNTLVVQKINYKLNVDDKQRVISTSTGQGEAQIFMNGQVFNTVWQKECATCRTRYFNQYTGNEFVFKPGKVWVSITRNEEKIDVK
jgi:hypothetical protein